MKAYLVDKVIQDDLTENPLWIDGKIYHWIMRSENMIPGETLQRWIQRKTDEIKIIIEKDDILKSQYEKIEALAVYDLKSVLLYGLPQSAMIIRYAYLHKDKIR